MMTMTIVSMMIMKSQTLNGFIAYGKEFFDSNKVDNNTYKNSDDINHNQNDNGDDNINSG